MDIGSNYHAGDIVHCHAAPRANSTGHAALRYVILEDRSTISSRFYPQYAIQCEQKAPPPFKASLGKEAWVPYMTESGQQIYLNVEGLHQRLGIPKKDIREAARANRLGMLIDHYKAAVLQHQQETKKALLVLSQTKSMNDFESLFAVAKNGPDKEILDTVKSYLGYLKGSSFSSDESKKELNRALRELENYLWF